MIYWIIGIVLLIVIGLYFLNKRNPATSNIASRYYALKDIFGDDDEISNVRYLQMAGVFSQIVYVQNGKMSVEEITEEAKRAVNNNYGDDYSGEEALTRFCIGLNELIYQINGLDLTDANRKAEKETELHEKTVRKIKSNGYSKLSYSSTNNYIQRFPGCLSGNFVGI